MTRKDYIKFAFILKKAREGLKTLPSPLAIDYLEDALTTYLALNSSKFNLRKFHKASGREEVK